MAEQWLMELPELTDLRNVGLVILGDERCENGWLTRYLPDAMSEHNVTSLIRFVYLVYDSGVINDSTVLPFPLGVAT